MKKAEAGAQRNWTLKMTLTVIVVAIGIIIALTEPFSGLDQKGHIVLGSVIAGIATWIFQPGGGSFMIGAVIIFLGGTFAGVPMNDMAWGYSSSTLWLLIPAMFLGYALLKTGLGKRIVFVLFKSLNLTYIKILVGWFVVGLLFSLLTPSITVRFLILTPIAVSVADACCLEKHSKGRSLIIIAAFSVCIFPGLAWLNGSLFGPVFTSFLPVGLMQEMATESMWTMVIGVPSLVLSILFLIMLYFMLKPEQKLTVTKETISQMYKDLGGITRDEKVSLIIFVFLLVGLALQNFLPYNTNQLLLVVFALLLFFNVFSAKEISTGINWDIVAFFGTAIGLGHIFEVSGITAWLSPILASLITPIAGSLMVFTLVLYVIAVVLRFVDVAQGWVSTAIFAMATPMLFADFGIHPLILLMVFITASNLFIFRYHQPWVGLIESVCGDGGWDSKHLFKVSLGYVVLGAVILFLCVFYWQLIGVY